MGNPLSPLLCEVFMENLENELEGTGGLPRFWIRYVDDILAIIKREEAGTILEKLNRAHRNIDFTLEIENEGEIPFLDLKIIRERGNFEFDIYRKPTQPQRTITYTSNHDFHHKMAAYNFMIPRMVTTPFNEERRNEEMNYILETAKKNGYNRNLIENQIKRPSPKTATFNTLRVGRKTSKDGYINVNSGSPRPADDTYLGPGCNQSRTKKSVRKKVAFIRFPVQTATGFT